jgi:DNA anti-recombination protein RmuC
MSSKDVKESVLKTVYNFEELSPEKKHELEAKMEAQQSLIEAMQKEINRIKLVTSGSNKPINKRSEEELEAMAQ